MGTTVIRTPEQAQLGRSPDGFVKARDEWWSGMQGGAQEKGSLYNGMGYANGQTGANAPQAQEDQRLSDQAASGAGGHQNYAIGLAGTMARGQQPSAAAQQLQSGLVQGLSQQNAMARGARGGAAVAVADANRMGNQAAMQQQAYSQAQALRANEMAAGRGMYGSMLGQKQDQDQFRLGMNTQMQQQNSQVADSYALGMGNAAVGIGNALVGQDAVDRGFYQGGMGAVNAQTEADQARQRWLAEAQKQKVAANMED